MSTDHFGILRPRSDWYFEDAVVNIYEASLFGPFFQVLPRRAASAHLVASAIEDFAEFDELVVFASAAVFAVAFGVEILKLDPSTWLQLTAISLGRRNLYQSIVSTYS